MPMGLGLRSGAAEEPLGRANQHRIGQRFSLELAGLLAVLQLVQRPGRQADAKGALAVLPGLAVAGPIIGVGRARELLASLAVCGPAPAQGVLVEADDADEIRRLALDDDEPVFLGNLPEHGGGAVQIPCGAGVIAEAVGLVAPAPWVGR